MAVTGLLALLDDLGTILDDVAVLSKVAARKTMGIAGDDLAVGANSVVGIDPKRELPIVWKIGAGSMLVKVPLIGLALALPTAAITPLLMLGGAFLCYEGYHKSEQMYKKYVKKEVDPAEEEHHKKMLEAIKQGPDALLKLENQKVKQALITDIVLSAEIVAISLGAMAAAPLATKAIALATVGFGMTVGIYGLIACIVKADDIGLWLQKKENKVAKGIGYALVNGMPKFMKGLSFAGTAAMFAVGGGILMHGIPGAETLMNSAIATFASGGVASTLGFLGGIGAGVLAGFGASHAVHALEKPFGRIKDAVMKALGRSKKNDAVATTEKTPDAPDMTVSPVATLPTLKADVNAAAAQPAVQLPIPDPTGKVESFANLVEKAKL